MGERHHEPYLVVEYAGGGSLSDWIRRGEPVPVSQALEWGRDLAQALSFLHRRGVVHRDVKSDNVLVTNELQIKLADFGAATPLVRKRSWLSLPEPTEGTPEYLSPEQVAGARGDERSDIYSWGVVMYELLAGRVPFTGPDPASAMQAHLTGELVPASVLRPTVPPALDAVVGNALRRDPDRRYPSAEALVADLDHLDSLDPASFDRTPDPPLAGMFARSEIEVVLRLAAAIAVTFLVISASAVVLTVFLH